MSDLTALTMAGVIAFAVTAASGLVIIPWLRKLNFGQTILDIGPTWHKKKQGTPNMGGFMLILGVVCAFAVTMVTFYLVNGNQLEASTTAAAGSVISLLYSGVWLALGGALIWFAEDYSKVRRRQNQGLSPRQKSIGQLAVSGAFLVSLYSSGNTWWYIPFYGKVDMADILWGIPFWVLGLIIVYGTMNSVNLTDGIDGLASSVTVTVGISFLLLALLQSFTGLGILSACVIGSCLGFLVWNWNPAKTFMGDTGSLFLGGLVVAMGFAVKSPLILLPIGIVYVCETLSVILQVTYFKLTHGKRIFKMSPIHHHFEMSGWKEKKICVVFSIASLIGGAVGVALMYYGQCY
ncbi:MAG: phospho-N-acetylmuramoyl-pentapeptide-transferase [Clostridiales bacterium]|nr:phospho-N-acetylmuramoyl-pentapeptide-transferase [Clostridiales bacterium]